MFPWIAQLLISVALNVVAAILMPRPKASRPEAFKDMESPTADAGKPIPVVFGEVEVRELNVLWFGDKATVSYDV